MQYTPRAKCTFKEYNLLKLRRYNWHIAVNVLKKGLSVETDCYAAELCDFDVFDAFTAVYVV